MARFRGQKSRGFHRVFHRFNSGFFKIHSRFFLQVFSPGFFSDIYSSTVVDFLFFKSKIFNTQVVVLFKDTLDTNLNNSDFIIKNSRGRVSAKICESFYNALFLSTMASIIDEVKHLEEFGFSRTEAME
jgi:hypothetical protein